MRRTFICCLILLAWFSADAQRAQAGGQGYPGGGGQMPAGGGGMGPPGWGGQPGEETPASTAVDKPDKAADKAFKA